MESLERVFTAHDILERVEAFFVGDGGLNHAVFRKEGDFNTTRGSIRAGAVGVTVDAEASDFKFHLVLTTDNRSFLVERNLPNQHRVGKVTGIVSGVTLQPSFFETERLYSPYT